MSLFAEVDLHPDVVPNHQMGSVFEELIRRFNEKKNEEAGDHYTPREIIRLMVDLLFTEDDAALRKGGVIRTLYDPACGTGGMLSVAEDRARERRLRVNGSPLFTGDAGSGESEIRRWILENDWLEAIVALPDQLFYNTGISTYIWVLTNRKPEHRKGKVQLVNAVDLYRKMRKSLGNKRNELAQEHIDLIAKTFGDFEESEISKVFDNEDFGYRRIVIERPLRLAFQASAERLARLAEQKAFTALATSKKKGAAGEREAEEGRETQRAILAALERLGPDRVYTNRALFEDEVEAALKRAGVRVGTPVRKAIVTALGERDEAADVCTDAKGRPEPDGELRDYENVPLKESIAAYFEREVKPHVPDAWIAGVELRGGEAVVVDESKVRVGYEIPITRHFYKYKPLRPLAEIEGEIRELEGEIQGLLAEVLS